MKMLFVLCSRNTGHTQKNALSKLRVVIITVQFSSCAAGYEGRRPSFNLSLVWKTDVAKMNSECGTNTTDLHLPGIVWNSPKAVGVTGFVSFIFCQFITLMWVLGVTRFLWCYLPFCNHPCWKPQWGCHSHCCLHFLCVFERLEAYKIQNFSVMEKKTQIISELRLVQNSPEDTQESGVLCFMGKNRCGRGWCC